MGRGAQAVVQTVDKFCDGGRPGFILGDDSHWTNIQWITINARTINARTINARTINELTINAVKSEGLLCLRLNLDIF